MPDQRKGLQIMHNDYIVTDVIADRILESDLFINLQLRSARLISSPCNALCHFGDTADVVS
jgi:hypothetical protein